MQVDPAKRRYIPLRSVRSELRGFARLEHTAKGWTADIQAGGEAANDSLRALLLCGDEIGAAENLGALEPAAQDAAMLKRTLPAFEPRLWDAIVLAEDWPSGRIAAVGFLHAPPGCSVWQLQEAASRFLSVPTGDTAKEPAQV